MHLAQCLVHSTQAMHILSFLQAHSAVLNSESSEYLPGLVCPYLLEIPIDFNNTPLALSLRHKFMVERIKLNFCSPMKKIKYFKEVSQILLEYLQAILFVI